MNTVRAPLTTGPGVAIPLPYATVIIALSIPLSILGSVIAPGGTAQTLNLMTLGGLALAVGILLDDARVTFENITWHLEQGKDVEPAILDGAQQIVGPAFVLKGQIAAVAPPLHEPKQAVSPACPRFR